MINNMNHIDQLKNILKTDGLRYTKQRQQVWDEIRISSEHRDAEAVSYTHLTLPTSDLV